MGKVLDGLSWKTCLVYLDDVIVFGKDFETTLTRLSEVFDRLRNAGLKLSPKKCELFQRSVAYLGHIVTTEGVKVDPTKIEAIRNWPVPTNVTELRGFIGLCSYYRKFIRSFAKIARPLHSLTEKRQYVWTNPHNEAFETLKTRLMSSPILAYPDPEGSEFVLDTDASNLAIGAVLSQIQNGEEKVIGYYSHALSKPETNYCVTRKELLAIVESVKHFHCYLYGRHFRLRTDHGSLRWLTNFKEIEGQLARWLEVLGTYDYEIEHRAGSRHGNADAMSRRPCEDCAHCERVEQKNMSRCDAVRNVVDPVPTTWISGISQSDISRAQRNDATIGKIISKMEACKDRPKWEDISMESTSVKTLWAQWKRLELRDDILYRKWEDDSGKHVSWQLVVPTVYRPDVLRELHDAVTAGHLGVNKTLSRVRERFYWPGVGLSVKDWCRKCHQCCARKRPPKSFKAPMKIYNVGAPMERIALDIMGPLPLSENGNKYVLVIGDYFTKWIEAYPMPDQEAETVAKLVVEQFVSRYGVPLQIHSDQGRNFESRLFQGMCNLLGMEKTRTTALHPQSDGLIERFNQTVENMLATLVSKDQTNWDEILPMTLMAYRSAEQESTKHSPNMMMFGREIRLPVDLLFGTGPSETVQSESDYVSNLREKLCIAHDSARENIKNASEKQKNNYDYRVHFNDYKVGDYVWLFNPKRKVGLSPKLQSNWEGPYKITSVISDLVYRIQMSPSHKPRVVHYNRLKPCHSVDSNTELEASPDVNDAERADVQSSDDDESDIESIELGRGKRTRRPPDRLTY